ncbi:hypothetical protein WCT94_16180 [Pectobacterium sp. 1950-15]|uniref:hypothetical protein n=1 Tax=Pectobacterium sp. 1950-15 TaxID=3128982 RepID=UPI00301785A6
MKTETLNPEKDLTSFFLLDRAFVFHDQRRAIGDYTYGCFTPEIVHDDRGNKTSGFHLTTTPAGGLVTLITPVVPLDTQAIRQYIQTHITHSGSNITLEQCDAKTTLFLRFHETLDDSPYLVEFEKNSMPITHAEGVALTEAIQGDTKRIFLTTHTQFTVSTEVNARLNGDWRQFLILAFNTKTRTPEAIAQLLDKQIDAGVIMLDEEFKNTPSPQTKEKVRKNLVDLAASVLSNTLSNISHIDEIPTKIDYDFSYESSLSQSYELIGEQDIASLFSGFIANKLISYDPSPLPEPQRKQPDDPGNQQTCKVSLDFNPGKFAIMSIELAWADKKVPMQWPNFPPLTITADGHVNEITIKVTFSDYSFIDITRQWQADINLSIQDIGFHDVTFDARHLQPDFKTISGSATYYPDGQAKRAAFSFSFSDQQWQTTWLLNTRSNTLNGRIEYHWQGKTSSFISRNYDSGVQQSTLSRIELQYKK